MTVDPMVLATILGMAAVTYAARIGGYVLVRRLPVRGRFKAGLEAVPAAILTAIIAPVVLAAGPADGLAALVTVLMAARLPMLVAVAGGVGVAILLRGLIG
jgi:uncharacterized membrane protein